MVFSLVVLSGTFALVYWNVGQCLSEGFSCLPLRQEEEEEGSRRFCETLREKE